MNRVKLNMLYQQEQKFNLNDLEDDGSEVSEEIPIVENVPEQDESSDKDVEHNLPQPDVKEPEKIGELPVKLPETAIKISDVMNNHDQGSSTQRVSKGSNKPVKKQEEGIEEVMLDVGAIRDNIVRQAQKKQQEYWKGNGDGEIEDDDDGAHSEEPEVHKSIPREPSPDHYLDAQLVDESFEQQFGIQTIQQPREVSPTDPKPVKKDKEHKQKQDKKGSEIYKPHEGSPPRKKQPSKPQKIIATKFNMDLPFEVNEQPTFQAKDTDKKKTLYNPKSNSLFQTVVGRQYIPMIYSNGNKETKETELENMDDLPEFPTYNYREFTELILSSAKASARAAAQVSSSQKIIKPKKTQEESQIRQQTNQERLQQQLEKLPEHTVELDEEPEEKQKIAFILGKRFLTDQIEYKVQYSKKNSKLRQPIWVPQSQLNKEDIFRFEVLTHQSFLKLMIEQGQEKQVPPTIRILNGRLIVPKIISRKITKHQSERKEANGRSHNNSQKENQEKKSSKQHKEHKKRPDKERIDDKPKLIKTIKPKSELFDIKNKDNEKNPENQVLQERKKKRTMTTAQKPKQIVDEPQEEELKVPFEVLEFLDADMIKFIEPSADIIKKMSRKKRDKREYIKEEPQKEAIPSTTSQNTTVKWIPPKKQPAPLEKLEDEALYIKKLKQELFQSPQRQNKTKTKKEQNTQNQSIYDPLNDDEIELAKRKKRRLKKLKEEEEGSASEFKATDQINDNVPLKRRLRPTKDPKCAILDADIMMIHFQELVRTKFGKNINILGHLLNSQNRMVLQIQDGKEQTSCYVEDLIHTHTEQLALYLREQILSTEK